MAQHTPGPWKIYLRRDRTKSGNERPPEIECDAFDGGSWTGGGYIARLHPYHMEFSREMTMANAHLMAASPEMLAALKLVIKKIPEPPKRECSCHVYIRCHDCAENLAVREAFAAMKRAISRAEGR